MIREREDMAQRKIEKEIAESKRKMELEENAKIEEEVHKVMNERVDDFTKGELLEIMNGTEKGQHLLAERKARLDEDMEACTTSTSDWYNLPSLEKKCFVELLLSTLEKENWTLITAHAYGSNTYYNAYHFTRPVQTS